MISNSKYLTDIYLRCLDIKAAYKVEGRLVSGTWPEKAGNRCFRWQPVQNFLQGCQVKRCFTSLNYIGSSRRAQGVENCLILLSETVFKTYQVTIKLRIIEDLPDISIWFSSVSAQCSSGFQETSSTIKASAPPWCDVIPAVVVIAKKCDAYYCWRGFLFAHHYLSLFKCLIIFVIFVYLHNFLSIHPHIYICTYLSIYLCI